MGDNGKITGVNIITGNDTQLGSFATGFNVEDQKDGEESPLRDGDYVGVLLDQQETRIRSLFILTKYSNIPNSAWNSASSVTIGGRSYTVPSDVLCYNKASGKWFDSLDEAHAFATTSTVYTDKSGYVRVVEVQ